MPTFELSDAEFDLLTEIFDEHGSDCPYIDSDAMQALAEKLGIWGPIPPPTEEELKRREEFANSPNGKLMRDLMLKTNESLAKHMLDCIPNIYSGEQSADPNIKIGTTLRIRLPNDFTVKETVNLTREK